MNSLRLLILTLAMLSAPVHAAPVTYYFGGMLSYVETALAPHFLVGNAFSGSFTFDSSSPDINPDPLRGTYAPGPRFFASVNGVQYSTTGGGGGSVGVDNNFGGNDTFGANSAPLPAETQPEIGGYLPDLFGLVLQDSSGTAFIDDTLPVGGLNLDDFNVGRFEMNFLLTQFVGHTPLPFFASIYGELSYVGLIDPSNNNKVPEPGSVLLLVMGMGALAINRRKARMSIQILNG